MPLRNARGTPVDPIPFLIAVAAAFLLLYSFGPGYLLHFGLSVPVALAATTGLFAATVVAAYYRYVHDARPSLQAEIPVGARMRRLIYATALGIALVVLLLLPVHVT